MFINIQKNLPFLLSHLNTNTYIVARTDAGLSQWMAESLDPASRSTRMPGLASVAVGAAVALIALARTAPVVAAPVLADTRPGP